jgi:hypothetical protein
MQAIKLMCLNEGWLWTSNVFLKVHVKNELDFLSDLSKSSSHSELNHKRVKQMLAYYFYLQGNIISHLCSIEKDSKPDAIETIKSFSLLLNSSQNDIGEYNLNLIMS